MEAVIYLIFYALVIGLQVVIAYYLYDTLIRVPRQYRATEPYFAWLTLIPIAGLVFGWILYPFKIPQSLKSYYESTGRIPDGAPADFGKGIGLGYIISATACIIPIVNFIAWIPALVFFIIYLVKLGKMRQLLPTEPDKSPAPINPQVRQAAYSADRPDKYEQLNKLKKLKDEGVLTDDEFAAEKKKLLG
jgi:hypothetical protein